MNAFTHYHCTVYRINLIGYLLCLYTIINTELLANVSTLINQILAGKMDNHKSNEREAKLPWSWAEVSSAEQMMTYQTLLRID